MDYYLPDPAIDGVHRYLAEARPPTEQCLSAWYETTPIRSINVCNFESLYISGLK